MIDVSLSFSLASGKKLELSPKKTVIQVKTLAAIAFAKERLWCTVVMLL